ncbi:MAG: hypothetical protein HOL85_20160 [Rhodospirillaceae bacterium]|nr:hypothetical protein [Rhodospirillaceae bacterium]
MRGMILALTLLGMMTAGSAMAQTQRPAVLPDIAARAETPVQNAQATIPPPVAWGLGAFGVLAGLDILMGGNPLRWAAIGVGAAGGLLALNVVTAGAVMTPIVGSAAAQAWGGSLIAGGPMTPAATQIACRAAAIASVVIAGGLLGASFFGG